MNPLQSGTEPQVQARGINMPKGGGAIKGMGESFSPDGFSGTGGFSVPLPFSKARGFEPELELSYHSSSGNGPFGLGMSVSIPKISRSTDKKGIPLYNDEDVFLDNGEELVKTNSEVSDGFTIDTYQPRIEQNFDLIQRWTSNSDGNCYWQIITRDNVTHQYGQTEACRIADPARPDRTFEWLLQKSFDDKENSILYHYKPEDASGTSDLAWEQNRACSQKYIEKIQYGYLPGGNNNYVYELIFDYGEYQLDALDKGGQNPHIPTGTWACRPDAFSSYRSGFEIRTRRRCQHVLLFHHFSAELGDPCLVKSLSLKYQDQLANPLGNPGRHSLLASVVSTGYRRQGQNATDTYQQKSLPPVELQFSEFVMPQTLEFSPINVVDENQNVRPLKLAKLQPIDLDGEGINGLLATHNQALWYLAPLGNGNYAPPKLLRSLPAYDQNQPGKLPSLVDLTGNGELDLLIESGPETGYYPRNDDGGWGEFEPLKNYPNLQQTPYFEKTGLSGNGLSDGLVIDERGVLIYKAKSAAGYDAPVIIEKPFAFPYHESERQSLVTFADPVGDGLSHRMKVSSGSVSYWPDLGHGYFGDEVAMGNAPVFDEPFDSSRLHLADIDGSGTVDLVYISSNQLTVYINQSGNQFAAPVHLALPETYSPIDHVGFGDVLGNGTTCLLFTKSGVQPRHYFYSFVGETQLLNQEKEVLKPYMLSGINNNLGKRTEVSFSSSTKFYLADKQKGNAWVNKIRFPVQVIEKTTTIDELSGMSFVKRFAYHDGYYDTEEREFRGFGFVESWDTERASQVQLPKEVQYVPPVYTRSWYHTGVLNGEQAVDKAYQAMFFQGDGQAYTFPDNVLPKGMDEETTRQAHMALKGHLIRQEIYGEDGSALADKPYTVTQSNAEIKLLKAQNSQRPFAVFMILPGESITYHYERNPKDPRIEQHFTLATDNYGHVLESCSVTLARRSQTAQKIYAEQQSVSALLHETTYANRVQGYRMLGIAYEEKSFELCNFPPPASGSYYTLTEVAIHAASGLTTIVPYESTDTPTGLYAKRLAWTKSFYWNEGQKEVLNNGSLPQQAPVLLHHEAHACFEEKFLTGPLQGRLTSETLPTYCGYWLDKSNEYYWNRGLVHIYADKSGFYQPVTMENSFSDPSSALYRKSDVTLDPYALYAIKATEYVNAQISHSVLFSIDYITGNPNQQVDINGNVSQVVFDPLGHVRVSSLFKPGNGSTPVDGGMVLFPYKQLKATYKALGPPASMEEVLSKPETYLQGANHFFYYDFDQFQAHQKPSCTLALTAINDHYSANQTVPNHQTTISFADGFGTVVETKRQVETASNVSGQKWQVTGKVLYNNKGLPCAEYLPYFSQSAEYEAKVSNDNLPPTILSYDALGRMIKKTNPKQLFSKVTYGPWVEQHYDENDTVKDSSYYKAIMNGGKNLGLSPTQLQDETDAMTKAAVFYNTPIIHLYDNMGRVFLEVDTAWQKETLQRYETFRQFDVLGRTLSEVDPRLYSANQSKGSQYFNFKYQYAMGLKDPVVTGSVDAGTEIHLPNLYGEQCWSWSPRGFCQLISYDHLGRKAEVWVKQITAPGAVIDYTDFNLVEAYQYGETTLKPQLSNLNGRLAVLQDLSGELNFHDYDLRGKPTATTQRFLQDYQNQANWAESHAPALESTNYAFTFEYDALGHQLTETTPDGALIAHSYDQRGLPKTIQVHFKDGSHQAIINDIQYNAQDQRARLLYGNQTQTNYTYEPTTSRLQRLCSTKTGSQVNALQDLNYTYDPVGNVTRLRDLAFSTVFHSNQKVKPLSGYTYDALYRLIKATGRQHPGIQSNQPATGSMPGIFSLFPSINDTQAAENYSQQYQYDAAGNLLQVQHTAASASWTRNTAVTATNNRLEGYTYDASGNMQSLGPKNGIGLRFNCFENLVNTTLVKRQGQPNDMDYYIYNAAEHRNRKVAERLAQGSVLNMEDKRYMGSYQVRYNGTISSGNPFQKKATCQTLRIMDGEACVCLIHTNSKTSSNEGSERTFRFQFSNEQDSVSLELDEQARLLTYETYFPYGGTAFMSGCSLIGAKEKIYRYSGKEWDSGTGLYYYGFRYYAPWLGRWLKPDPAGTIDGPNLYAFVGGNPVTHVDVGGMAKSVKKESVKSSRFRFAREIQRRTATTRNILTMKLKNDSGVRYLIFMSTGVLNEKYNMAKHHRSARRRGHTEAIALLALKKGRVRVGRKFIKVDSKDVSWISSSNQACTGKNSEECANEVVPLLPGGFVYSVDYKPGNGQGANFSKEVNKHYDSDTPSDDDSEDEAEVFIVGNKEKDFSKKDAELEAFPAHKVLGENPTVSLGLLTRSSRPVDKSSRHGRRSAKKRAKRPRELGILRRSKK